MRERSTWNREEIVKKAGLDKKADPYTMNQDHPQPKADKYVTGDPSSFAEDVHSPNTWETEYSGDEVKRNEIGMPEMRGDTFNHSEKTASEVMLKKADLCIAVARLMLAGKKTASEQAIEDQAFALMFTPDRELIATYNRLAEDQEEAKQESKSDEGQEKQAEQKDEEKSEDKAEQKQAQEESKSEEKKDEGQEKQAQGQDQESEKKDDEGQDKQAQGQDQQMQQMAQQIQQMIQSGQLAQAQQQIQQMMQQAQGQQQMQQAPVQQQADDQVLDQMLAQDSCGPMAEADIQMEPAPMDVGMGDLGPEDEILRQLFANDDEQGEDDDQDQKKQATIRTASTRTVGTRPTAGVSRIGGGASSSADQGSVESLSSLWESAPDVRSHFGIK